MGQKCEVCVRAVERKRGSFCTPASNHFRLTSGHAGCSRGTTHRTANPTASLPRVNGLTEYCGINTRRNRLLEFPALLCTSSLDMKTMLFAGTLTDDEAPCIRMVPLVCYQTSY